MNPQAFARAIAPLRDRVRLMLGRAVIAAVNDGALVQELQLEMLEDEAQDGVEHFQQYGLTAVPPVGLEALVGFVGGLRSHGVVLAVGDRQYRMRGLQGGEVALYDDQGQSVHLRRDGIYVTGKALTVDVEGAIALTGESCTVDAETIAFNATTVAIAADNFGTSASSATITADSIVLATDDLALGNGAELAAARTTDAVSSSTITGGSTKVKIA